MSSIIEQSDMLIQTLYHENTHIHVDTSVSTNSELMTSIIKGMLSSKQVHLLTADSQTQGRGQGNRSWQSPKGNVYLSLFYPTQHHQYPLSQPISGLLSLCVGYFLSQLPVIQQINRYRKDKINSPICSENDSCLINDRSSRRQMPYPKTLAETGMIGVKWANDIGYYATKKTTIEELQIQVCQFHKLSGILIEPVISNGNMLGIIIGVGLNVKTAPCLDKKNQEGMNYQSVSLQDLLKNNLSLSVQDLYQPINKAIFQAILTHQMIASNKVARQKFLLDFSSADILLNRQLRVRQDKKIITGRAVGIDKFGCLQLEGEDGKITPLFTGKIDVID